MAFVVGVQFEHYHHPNTLGVQDKSPRLSWRIDDPSNNFIQSGYEVELTRYVHGIPQPTVSTATCNSSHSSLVPWPYDHPLQSRQKISVRVRVWDDKKTHSPWSEPSYLETGLLTRSDWSCQRITAPWTSHSSVPSPEQLYRKEFLLLDQVQYARLYITAQGVYEAEINGQRVGDYFLAPGWTSYDGRLQYQTYDVSLMLQQGPNCIGVRVAEGWFSGRIGFEGGHRNIWGSQNTLFAQLEITLRSGNSMRISSDGSWTVTEGPIVLAEIYDGEKYDATKEVPLWSSSSMEPSSSDWQYALVLSSLPQLTKLVAGYGEPVRRVDVVKPIGKLLSPLGKTIVDFGQNLVGYVRLNNIKGPRGHTITLQHAEVLEKGELGTRCLRICEATDWYTLRGSQQSEKYEPRFTFHGFRYVEIVGWVGDLNLDDMEAVVCQTDMKPAGQFTCSNPLLNALYKNVVWSMRGNFLSVPTDCPQRDERLGWTGDLALFAPTANLLYDCFGMLKNWLIDVQYDQNVLGGVPPMVSPNATLPDPMWCRRVPCAIWHDVTILAPWALYLETADHTILAQQYDSMVTWIKAIPRDSTGASHLWDPAVFQLGDWLDPAAPPDAPWKSATDSKMVANMFLIQSLDIMTKIAQVLDKEDDMTHFVSESTAARKEFQSEYVTPNGRIASDSQTAYALGICLDILSPAQKPRAASRLAELVRKNGFKIGTGFAGTPFICEALAATGYTQVAYSMLLEKSCPSWLYPVTMGSTTVWERWDSMLPDGSINPGEMTSFNHYAFGAVAKFLFERIAGLQRLEPGWKRFRVAPLIGAEFSYATGSHVTPYGVASCSWKTSQAENSSETFTLKVSVPTNTIADIIIPDGKGERMRTVGPGDWEFHSTFTRDYEWPVLPLKGKS
ncbi:bacterial alpha-L-rhamnosidase domain protein [Mariannaea sp. PMI_226]|nr:bacterial alpha-L-rhamnosidase domain protein [Mariannaea sp. PMI_226]